jgi:tetratricopeptide (TPR) repeat protein
MTTKLTKEDLKNDAMTQELRKGFTWSVKHYRIVIGFLAAFIVVGIGYSIKEIVANNKESSAQEKYFQAEKKYLTQKESLEVKDEDSTDKPLNKKDKKPVALPAVKASGDIDKDYGPAITDFQAVIKDAPNSKGARMAALLLSEVYSQYNQKPKGLDALKALPLGQDLLSILILDRIATLSADQGDCKAAITDWDKILKLKESAFIAGEVKLKKGLCFESLKDFAQAQAMYNQAKDTDSKSAIGRRAEKYLRGLQTATN